MNNIIKIKYVNRPTIYNKISQVIAVPCFKYCFDDYICWLDKKYCNIYNQLTNCIVLIKITYFILYKMEKLEKIRLKHFLCSSFGWMKNINGTINFILCGVGGEKKLIYLHSIKMCLIRLSLLSLIHICIFFSLL